MINGSIVALVTPMKQDGSIDYVSIADLVEWHVESGTDAIVVAGTTGESATLLDDEYNDLLRFVVEQSANRIPIIAGTGTSSTYKTIERTKCAKNLGVDACLIVTPYYNKPNQVGLYEHYKAIANAVNIKQIIYNVPSRTGCNILPETVIKLSNCNNIVGIKEGIVEQAKAIIEGADSRIAVYSGDDSTGCDIIALGGKGIVSVAANVFPKLLARMCKLAIEGNMAIAREIDDSLKDLYKCLFFETNPIPVKWILHSILKRIPSGIRLPLVTLNKKFYAEITNIVEKSIAMYST